MGHAQSFRDHTHLFTTVLGSERGLPETAALTNGEDTANVRAEVARLTRQLHHREFANTLEVLYRVFEDDPSVSSEPLETLIAAFVVVTIDESMNTDIARSGTKTIMRELHLRDHNCEHMVVVDELPWWRNGISETALHFAVVSVHRPQPEIELACGAKLTRLPVAWRPALRGDWLSGSENSYPHCQGCAAVAHEFEESRENADYPALTEAQAQAVAGKARQELTSVLPGVFEVEGALAIKAWAMNSYRLALSDVVAEILPTYGEGVVRAILLDTDYEQLIREARPQKTPAASEPAPPLLSSLLNASDWREIIGGRVGQLLPIPGSTSQFTDVSAPVAACLIRAIRSRIQGRPFFS